MPSTSLNSSGLPAPASQKERVIYFRLIGADTDTTTTNSKGNLEFGHYLSINPEDLTVTEPSRVSVQQTIDSAWVDSFGSGLRTINISGTTGWRAKHKFGRDWEEEYQSLHKEAFQKWHEERKKKVVAGLDPKDIKLMFVDTLDRIAVYVVPQQFVLKRSKSRPLLVQYNIGMMVLEDIDYSFPVPTPAPDKIAALSSFDQTVKDMEAWAKDIAALTTYALQAINKILAKINRAINAVNGIMHSVGGLTAAVSAIIKKIIAATKNLFAMLAAIINLPKMLRLQFQQVCSGLNNLKCLFVHGLQDALVMQNYGDFKGASNCSSTTGGSPLSPLRDTNGFALLPIEARRPRLPKPVSAPESLAHKAARQALADARATARRDARAAALAKEVWDSVAQFAIDHPSDTATANANAKHAIYLTKTDIAATSQAAADQAAITFATTP